MDRKHQCPTCGKELRHKYNLQRHMRIQTSEKPYKCNLCGKSFSDYSNLNRHLKVHSNKKPFKCNYDDCKKSFKSKSELKQHTYALHSDEILSEIPPNDPKIMSRICKICKKVCQSPAALKTHMRTHTGKSPFSCNFCNATFNTKSILNRHIRSIHLKEKTPYCTEKRTKDVQREQRKSFGQPSTSFQRPESIEFEEIPSDQNLFTLKEFLETVNVNLGIVQQNLHNSERTQDVQREQRESFEQSSTSFQRPQSIESEDISSEENLFTLQECEEFLENVNVNLEIIKLEGWLLTSDIFPRNGR
ncbi:zinc finger protein 761-like [Centruroides sculpturatus]|uniref:zinc finger protein 761-like n=1 Tax=Centruroides sculpturatus TaxID=218467 RepID=UPI000C6DA59D|nr:zinc finger protein 761-like [Centruroides sculpturatus]